MKNNETIIDFVRFLQTKVYNPKFINDDIINQAFNKTIEDVKYHFPNLSTKEIVKSVCNNSNELAVFLFRLGSELHNQKLENLKPQIHWLLKELCGCEIYFNNIIKEGFYVVHGEGLVIGSRNIIGKGFIIHQGCTIGHKLNRSGKGSCFGNDVTVYCNSTIIGELTIGNNVIIGANTLVNKCVDNDSKVINTNKMHILK